MQDCLGAFLYSICPFFGFFNFIPFREFDADRLHLATKNNPKM